MKNALSAGIIIFTLWLGKKAHIYYTVTRGSVNMLIWFEWHITSLSLTSLFSFLPFFFFVVLPFFSLASPFFFSFPLLTLILNRGS